MGKSLIFSVEGSRHKRASRHKSKPRKTKKTRISRKHKKEKFIQGAIKHRGSFTRYCNAKGYKGASQACIKHAIAHGSPRRAKQAVFARTLKKLSARRSKK